MRLSKQKTNSVVGLEIEAGNVAATEVQADGAPRVTASAIRPLEAGIFHEGEVLDPERLAGELKALFAGTKLSNKVRLGLGNQRVVVRTMRLPALEDPKEMKAAVHFQAQEQIPMPLDQAVLEYQVVGGVPAEEGSAPQVDVIVVAARRDMVSSYLAPIRKAGLQPEGVDLSAFAMIRALAGAEEASLNGNGKSQEKESKPSGAVLYCSLGDVTNLAVARGRSCLFTRVSYTGLEAIAKRLSAACSLIPEHAHQWLLHVGLEEAAEAIEGDPEIVKETRSALEDGVTALLDELRLSLDYYGAQEAALPVERIVLCGPGSIVPGLSERMEAGLDLPVGVMRPAALDGFDPSVAARLTLPFGLALES